MGALLVISGVAAYSVVLLVLAVKKPHYIQLSLGYFVFLIVVGVWTLISGFGLGFGNAAFVGIGITGSIISFALAKKARIILK
ncbi:MAG: hypothetical protein P3T54_05630 [Dehalogenimonas sp.]|jgi:hypothetical protein|uniref:YesK-like protein n=1 Tax=Candidatus Dehalogenimonas loeffleri TaxID=3127115 RepID=A0ABZ2J9J6_9CHLR|nr:hypothetical protein [Dehalogenimonas sp.]